MCIIFVCLFLSVLYVCAILLNLSFPSFQLMKLMYLIVEMIVLCGHAVSIHIHTLIIGVNYG